jgi:hypothetical protein
MLTVTALMNHFSLCCSPLDKLLEMAYFYLFLYFVWAKLGSDFEFPPALTFLFYTQNIKRQRLLEFSSPRYSLISIEYSQKSTPSSLLSTHLWHCPGSCINFRRTPRSTMSPHLTISSQLNLNPLPNDLTTQSLQQPPYICVHKQHHHRNRRWDGNLPKIDRSVIAQLWPEVLIKVHPKIPCDEGKRKKNK